MRVCFTICLAYCKQDGNLKTYMGAVKDVFIVHKPLVFGTQHFCPFPCSILNFLNREKKNLESFRKSTTFKIFV